MNFRPLVIGAVSYLNSQPLVCGLDRAGPSVKVVYDLPGRLADRLAAGELDVGLVPVIELFQNPDWQVVSDACIGCRGPVWSVKLLSRCPLAGISSLALDEGSRTSVVLVRILLQHHFGCEPQLLPLPIEADWRRVDSDAVLVIGDRAMRSEEAPEFPVQIDLGQWWYQWTELPFVFAVWAARRGLSADETDELGRLLSACRDEGLASAQQIAAHKAAGPGLTTAQCIDYFHKYLHFRLGPEEQRGLQRFRDLACERGLAPPAGELVFHAR